jgi:DNA-directed RNA polymerase sigma subunit (sigma70/sigma32)
MEVLDEITLSCDVQHLQIHPKIVKILKICEIHSIGDFVRESIGILEGRDKSYGGNGLDLHWHKIESEIEFVILKFSSAIHNQKLNWLVFWEEIDYEFYFTTARLDQVFHFDKDTLALQISKLNFGMAIFLMEAKGIKTVGDLVNRLVEGLPDYTGFGKTKMRSFAKGLRDFIRTINCEGTRSTLCEKNESPNTVPTYRGTLQFFAKNAKKMSEKTADLTLEKIHLHKEIKKLNRIGIHNLGDLLKIFAKGLPVIRGIGAKARCNLLKIAKCVDLSINESGEIDWEQFGKEAGFDTIPSSQTPLTSGHEFLVSLEEVVHTLTTKYYDEMEAATLVDRLMPSKKNTLTLEEIGLRFGVSRERIRQIQKEVIEKTSAAVLDNNYQNLTFRFTQNFSNFWRDAAEYFSGNDVVAYNDFIDGLSIVWSVERHDLIPHLPLIYAILTNNLTLPVEFNLRNSVPPGVFLIKSPHDLNKSYKSLHPQKYLVRILDDMGIYSIGQFIGILRTENSIVTKRAIHRIIEDILDPLSKAVAINGEIDWQEFYKLKGIKLIPDVDTDSPATFANHAIESVSEFIQLTKITGRSSAIFQLRTIPEATGRKTLYQAGEILGCTGPAIKKEENDLLGRLHDAIFAEDFSATSSHFQPLFLNYWKRARKVYRQSSNPERFAHLLSMEWDLHITQVSKIIPMLICVIEGRPKGYTGKRYHVDSLSDNSQHESSESTNAGVIIRLRGFRNIH